MNNEDLLKEYRSLMLSRNKAKETHRVCINTLLLFTKLTKAKLIQPSTEQIVHFLSDEKWSDSYRYSKYCILNAFYRWMWEEQKLLTNPMDKVPQVKTPDKFPTRIMTWGETQKVLEHFPADATKPFLFVKRTYLEVLYSGSLRPGEGLSLNIDDFDKHTQTVRIRPENAKTKIGRIAPIGSRACELILIYLEKVRPVLVGKIEERNRRTQFKNKYPRNTKLYAVDNKALFLNSYGTRLSFQTVGPMMSKLRKELKIRSNPSLHSMRKSSGTHMLRNSAPLVTVAQILGHARDSDATLAYTKVYNADLVKMHRSSHPREKQKNYPMPKLEIPLFN